MGPTFGLPRLLRPFFRQVFDWTHRVIGFSYICLAWLVLESDQFFIMAGLASDPEKTVDGFILRPPGIERYSLVKDVVL